MTNEYLFQYNVASDNDAMGRTDFFLEMKAEMIGVCAGINPLIVISFLEMPASSLQRLISVNKVVSDCEVIALEYFKTENQTEFNLVRLPTVVDIDEEYYSKAADAHKTGIVRPLNKSVHY